MSFRNPPEKSHEERAGQAGGRLRGMLDSRSASQRRFFPSPSTGPLPSSSQGSEDSSNQISYSAAAAAPELPPSQQPVPEAIAASEHAVSSGDCLSATPPPQERPISQAAGQLLSDEGPSSAAIARREEIEDSQKQQPAAAVYAEAPKSNGYRGVERRGSFRYKVANFEILFAWRQGVDKVATGSAGTVTEPTGGALSGIGPAGNGSGGAGPKAVRSPEASSLPTDFDHHVARVCDISQTGLCLIVDRLPPDNRDLWVGVKGTRPIVWSRVILRSLSEPHPGCFMLRLSFEESCPYEFLKLAVTQKVEARAVTRSTELPDQG